MCYLFQSCRAASDGFSMSCLTPNLTGYHHVTDGSIEGRVYFFMDGVRSVTGSDDRFQYFVDPVIHSFTGSKLKVYFDELYLELQVSK